jgi:hypothetical protein
MSEFFDLEFRLGVPAWSSGLEFRLGVPAWSSGLEFRLGVPAWSSDLDDRSKQFLPTVPALSFLSSGETEQRDGTSSST